MMPTYSFDGLALTELTKLIKSKKWRIKKMNIWIKTTVTIATRHGHCASVFHTIVNHL